MELTAALEADSGLVCAVGAGGKKSTLYALADRLDRAVVTATVRIPIFDNEVGQVVVTEDPAGEIRDTSERQWPLGLVPEQERPDRYQGYDPAVVGKIARLPGVESTLVKADGARMRELKAPRSGEPRIPDGADVVVPIASVHAVGKELTAEEVHRPERVADVTGLSLGDRIRPDDVATTLASPAGGLKDAPDDATVIPLLNKVDDGELAETGREIAEKVHERAAVKRVVLTQMTGEKPVVDVIE